MSSNFFSAQGFVYTDTTPNSGHLICDSIDTAIAAAGTTAAGATPLVSSVNVLGAVPASSGVSLPSEVASGANIKVLNNTATAVTVYPPLGGTINGGSINAGISLAAASGGVPGRAVYLQTAALTYITA